MAVYIDPMMACIPNRNWKWNAACHMFADTPDELHAFARSIGLRREWFQDKRVPHYDLNHARRAAAIRNGAIEMDRRAAVAMWVQMGWLTRKMPREIRVY